MKRLAILGALALASCSNDPFKSEFSDAERDEIGDIAGDAVGDAVADDDKVRELESRIEELELQLQ